MDLYIVTQEGCEDNIGVPIVTAITRSHDGPFIETHGMIDIGERDGVNDECVFKFVVSEPVDELFFLMKSEYADGGRYPSEYNCLLLLTEV